MHDRRFTYARCIRRGRLQVLTNCTVPIPGVIAITHHAIPAAMHSVSTIARVHCYGRNRPADTGCKHTGSNSCTWDSTFFDRPVPHIVSTITHVVSAVSHAIAPVIYILGVVTVWSVRQRAPANATSKTVTRTVTKRKRLILSPPMK